MRRGFIILPGRVGVGFDKVLKVDHDETTKHLGLYFLVGLFWVTVVQVEIPEVVRVVEEEVHDVLSRQEPLLQIVRLEGPLDGGKVQPDLSDKGAIGKAEEGKASNKKDHHHKVVWQKTRK